MDRGWTENRQAHISAIDDILSSRQNPQTTSAATRYGTDGRRQQERERVKETYAGVTVELPSGELRGLFYYDISFGPHLTPDQTTLTIIFGNETLAVKGYRLKDLFRDIMNHSLDTLEITHRAEYEVDGTDPVIESIELTTRPRGH